MLNREKHGKYDENNEKNLHPLYVEKQFKDNTLFYYNQFNGIISLEFKIAPPDPMGGILADEMGLGKTIECIALILCNRANEKYSFDKDTKKYTTGITLIVCPLTLVNQWKSEFEKAILPSLKVYIHHGSARIKDPFKLLSFDIIITTYNTLSYEYNQLFGLTKKKRNTTIISINIS